MVVSISGQSSAPLTPGQARVAAAQAAQQRNAANRAVDDPVALARAARIVRVALERGKLTPADILPDEQPSQKAS